MNNLKIGKGKVIFAEGTSENCMYDIISGSVNIVADYGKMSEKVLTTLKEGSTFGELGMIENLPRSATAVANERTELNAITYDEFAVYFKDKPEKVMDILRNTSHRMRSLTKDYLDVCGCIAEYVKCEDNDAPVSDELMGKLKKIARAGKK